MPNPFLHKWTVLFQTVQFSISTQFNCQKHSFQAIQFSQTVLLQTILFSIHLVFCLHTVKCQNSSILNNSFEHTKTVPFQTIQFSTSIQFKCQTVQVQAIQLSISIQSSSSWPIDRTLLVATTPARVDRWAMAIKGYSAFLKTPALLEPHHQIV